MLPVTLTGPRPSPPLEMRGRLIMPRALTKYVYQMSELPETAKETARFHLRATGDMWDSSDWWNSATAFSGIAPIEITSADYDRGQCDIRWTGDADVKELSGLRAWKWLQNNGWFDWARKEAPGACSLTGFCGDAAFADPLLAYAKTPLRVPDLEQVFYECAQAWVFEARDDLEHAYSDEALDDMAEANGWEFDENGNWA